MTFSEFLIQLDWYNAPKGWRTGQYLFNVLYDHRPDLANQVRGSSLDPFHLDDRVSECLNWVAENWNKSEEASGKADLIEAREETN